MNKDLTVRMFTALIMTAENRNPPERQDIK